MLRPERMALTSIICVKKDAESLLEALSSFGEFHIEETNENVSPIQYNQDIQKAEESLSNVNELIKQLSQEKPGPFDLFKEFKPTRTQVTAENWQALAESAGQKVSLLKKEVDEFNNSLSSLQEKTFQLNNVKKMLTIIDDNHADLEAIQNLQLIHVTAASIPQKNVEALKTELAKFPHILSQSILTKETSFVNIAVTGKQGTDVEKIVKAHHGEIFSIPKDLPRNTKNALKEITNRLKENSEKEKAISESLHKLGVENKNSLPAWKETVENSLALLYAKKKLLQSGHLTNIEGFVPKKNLAALNEKVHSLLGDKAIILEDKASESETMPTKISNNRFVKPFEEITRLYGLPRYSELDPTPFMAISFPILFGLMFGDVGHGLILFAGGLGIYLALKKQSAIKNMAFIITVCGVAAIIAGLLYGELFGQPIRQVLGFGRPLWFDPFSGTTSVLHFLIFALAVGVAQISLGVVLEMANFVLERKPSDAVLVSLPKLAFYFGGVYVVVTYGLNIGAWFPGPVMLLVVPFIFMVIAKPAYLAIAKPSPAHVGAVHSAETHGEAGAAEQEGSLGQSIFESGDLISRFLSNTVSYSRILALLMAHWALCQATYAVAGQINGFGVASLVIGGIIIVGGNIFVIALEGLIVFIHTLRLHFYEWFTKFYKGTGTEFHPYKQNFIYTDVHFHENVEKT